MYRYFTIYKPCFVLSQFSAHEGKKTLADFFDVPKDVYPVGRLDYDSEGLLILTNDPSLNHRLLNPVHRHERTYLVQVEGMVTPTAIQQLEQGISINVNGKTHRSLPCKATALTTEPVVPERYPPIRFRQHIPVSWLQLTLTEGKNRQVRKMTASVGFPTLRLIRTGIEKVTLETLQPGEVKEWKKQALFELLFGKV